MALLFAVAIFLYARIAPSDLLKSTSRARLHALVAAAPGITVRELSRRYSGSWGAFSNHLGRLAKAGYLRTVRAGKYTRVFPRGSAADAMPPLLHPLARSLLEEVPADGRPVDVRELRSRLGVSRQRLDHHVRSLARMGRIQRDAEARTVRRVLATD